MPDGTAVDQYTLTCGEMSCEIITYGGALRSLRVPDRNETIVDVVLGFDYLRDYLVQDKYIGALIGRYANRIGGSTFSLNGTRYFLAANDGATAQSGDIFDELRGKFYSMAVGGTYDPTDPALKEILTSINDTAQDYWNRMNKNPVSNAVKGS